MFEAAGEDAINLGLGQPDFPAPAHARQAAVDAIEAGEIADRCGLPSSTTYRKLEEMTEVGVLDERVRFPPPGRVPSEYALRVENLRITIGDEDGVQLAMTRRDSEPTIPEFDGLAID